LALLIALIRKEIIGIIISDKIGTTIKHRIRAIPKP
jgi:hypothetical protein